MLGPWQGFNGLRTAPAQQHINVITILSSAKVIHCTYAANSCHSRPPFHGSSCSSSRLWLSKTSGCAAMVSYLDTLLLQLLQPFLLQLLSQLPAAEVSKVRQEGHSHHSGVSWLQVQLRNKVSRAAAGRAA